MSCDDISTQMTSLGKVGSSWAVESTSAIGEAEVGLGVVLVHGGDVDGNAQPVNNEY